MSNVVRSIDTKIDITGTGSSDESDDMNLIQSINNSNGNMNKKKYVIPSDSKFKTAWDIGSCILIVHLCIVYPL